MRSQRTFSDALRSCLLLASLCVPARATADDALAETLFDEGMRAKKAGDYAKACPLLHRAVEQKGGAAVGGLLELGDCWEKAAKTASAWSAYRRAAGFAKQQKDARQETARGHVERLEPGLHRVVISLAPGVAELPGLSIKRGTELVPLEALGIAVPVDAGALVVVAEAPGRPAFQREVVIPEARGITTITVPTWPAAAPPAPVREPAPEATAIVANEQHTLGPWGGVGIAATVLGAAGLATGLGLGLSARSSYEDAIQDPAFACAGGLCNAAGKAAVDEARALGDGATGSMVVGAALLAAGSTLLVVDLALPKRPQVAIAPGAVVLGWRLP